MDLISILVHKHANKELGQYPTILTSVTIWPAPQAGMQDKSVPESWLATLAGKLGLSCLLKATAVSHKKNFFEDHIRNPVLTTEACLVKMDG